MAPSELTYRAIVVIGPSGNGKSTLGRAIAERLGWQFIEGDDHHPPANIAKMSRGKPLTDEDREPFLDSVGKELSAGECVAACSALKRSYRDHLQQVAGLPILFVLPEVSEDELLRRLKNRTGHFMPPSLLQSQIEAFERPGSTEPCLLVDGSWPPADFARHIASQI